MSNTIESSQAVIRLIPYLVLQPSQFHLQLGNHFHVIWIRVHAVQLAGIFFQVEEFPFDNVFGPTAFLAKRVAVIVDQLVPQRSDSIMGTDVTVS